MKAQSSLEFIIMAGLFMMVFVVFFGIFGERLVEFHNKKNSELSNDILDKIESELLMAAEAHDGYKNKFYLPERVGGSLYNLSLNNSGTFPELTMDYLDKEYARIIIMNMSGNPIIRKPPATTIPNEVSRRGNFVYLNE